VFALRFNQHLRSDDFLYRSSRHVSSGERKFLNSLIFWERIEQEKRFYYMWA